MYLFFLSKKKKVSALKLDKFHLMGHSWGSMLALMYLIANEQNRVKKNERRKKEGEKERERDKEKKEINTKMMK